MYIIIYLKSNTYAIVFMFQFQAVTRLLATFR